MTATAEIPPTRAEINRRNAQRSTGPKTQAGKERSRFNALKHGCRARLPILPGEDPDAYRDRLDAWIDKFQPRDKLIGKLATVPPRIRDKHFQLFGRSVGSHGWLVE